jgi:hypothetical protein
VDALGGSAAIERLYQEFDLIKEKYGNKVPRTKKQISHALKTYKYPKEIRLPKDSDVQNGAPKIFPNI